MNQRVAIIGFWSGVLAAIATIAFDVVQTLQLTGTLQFPADEILIYSSSLCIVVPFIIEMLAFHHLTERDRQFWTLGALLFTVVYAVFVSANYVTQLATVIPAKLNGDYEAVRALDQTPHSMFWNFDAIAYISMGFAFLLAIPALNKQGFERWVRYAFLAHVLVTPLIAVVYFYPHYSNSLLLLGFPWGITAPLSMALLAVALSKVAARE